jgi:two-component system, sensor histidine kinase
MNRAIVRGPVAMTNSKQADLTGPNPRQPRVLVVDDHEVGRKALARLLGVLGYEITAVNDGASAILAMEQEPTFDYVLTDLRLPDLDGRDVVQAAHRLLNSPRIALITGWDVEPEESDRLGIDWVFLKPLDIQAIVAKLKQCPPPDLAPDVE